MKKFLAALFVATMLAGCAMAPVQYVQTEPQVVRVCDPVCRYVAVTPAQSGTAPVYVQQPVYVNPVLGIAAGYFIWRSIGGHHNQGHRR